MVHAHTHKIFAWSIRVFIFLLLLPPFLSAQTILIDPSGDGGFETGVNFESNGWTLVNYASWDNSNWYLQDSAVTNGSWGLNSGSRCAFISDSAGASWSYNSGNAAKPSAAHFYRDVTFPAGETNIILSFDLLCNGEGFNYDVFYVWLCPVTLFPLSGSPVAQSDITVWEGSGEATTLFKQQGFSSKTVRSARHVEIAIAPELLQNCTEAVSKRLVFGWKNDESMQYDPPVAIDNISLVTAPAIFPAGVSHYTIDNAIPSSPTNFTGFISAVSFINAASACSVLTDSLIFEVKANREFNENVPVITATGSLTAPIIFRRIGYGDNPVILASGTGSFEDAGITLKGSDNITFDGIDVKVSSGNDLEFGYLVRNQSSVNGASGNTIKNCSITLNKSVVRSIAVLQSASRAQAGSDPSSQEGANTNNLYQNITISNCYNGMLLTNQSEVYPDSNNIISGCTIGTPYIGTPGGNIGGLGTSSNGIQLKNQKNGNVSNNIIRNLTADGTGVRGIYILNASGNTTISGNRIYGIRNYNISSTSAVIGIDIAQSTLPGSHTAFIWNNSISDLTNGYTGNSTTVRVLKGIIIRGGNSNSVFNIDFNSVNINANGSPKVSSVVLEIATVITKNNARNNIFSNSTANQAGNLGHYIIASSALNRIGASGSVFNYNDYYLPFTGKGFTGVGLTTNYSTLTGWKTGMSLNPGIDVNTLTTDPHFLDPLQDLHSTASLLNGVANRTGLTWITTDFDGDLRQVSADIGADEFSTNTIDLGVTEVFAPGVSGCYNSLDSIVLEIRNFASHTLNFLANPTTFSVSVTGPLTYSTSLYLDKGVINALTTVKISMPVGFDIGTAGTYTISASVAAAGDINLANNNLVVNRSVVDTIQSIPYTQDFNEDAILPEGWSGTGFSVGTHTGAMISNQAFANISGVVPSADIVLPKMGPITETTQLSFYYRVTNFSDGTTSEEDPDWGTIRVMVSRDCGATFETIREIATAVSAYSFVQISLTDFANADIIIKIQTDWGGGATADFWVDLDDINISNSNCLIPDKIGDTFLNPIIAGDLLIPYVSVENNLISNCWSNNYGYISPDIYYRFIPVCTGDLTVSLCGTSFNTVVYLLDQSGNLLSSNDDFCGTASQISYPITISDVPYYIVVEGKTSAMGAYTLNATMVSVPATHYADLDGDSYGDLGNSILSCVVELEGYSANGLDCDDNNSMVNPAMPELCDGLDNDCNGISDENTALASLSPSSSVAICKGNTLVLSANTGVGYTYSWFKNGNLIPGATLSTYSTQKAGNYQVQVTQEGGCFEISTATVISVLPLPAAILSAPYGLSLCGSVGFSANAGTGFTYQWFKNGNLLAGVAAMQYHALSPGTYYCRITDANGCFRNSNSLVVTACKEGTEYGEESGFHISPNPVSTILNIEFNFGDKVTQNIDIQLINTNGEIVKSYAATSIEGGLNEEISVDDLPQGIYFIKIDVNGKLYNRTFVVSR